jgi:hypothetical protein
MSIESDIYAYIATDATLRTILGGSAADTRVYLIKAPQEKEAPYIVINSQGEGNINEEINDEIRFTFYLVASPNDYDKLTAMKNRVNILMDKQDGISITSADNYIYWSKKNGGADMFEDTTENFVKVINYDMKFQKITGGI